MTLEPVTRALDAAGIRYALIGAHAMAARGYPRFTVDIDLLTTDLRALDAEPWGPLVEAGARVDRRRGDSDDPLAGVVGIVLADATNVDVVIGRWRWERDLVARAEPMTVFGVTVGVPPTSDLILLKLAAGGRPRTMGRAPARLTARAAADVRDQTGRRRHLGQAPSRVRSPSSMAPRNSSVVRYG